MVVDYDKETEGQYGLVAPQTKAFVSTYWGYFKQTKWRAQTETIQFSEVEFCTKEDIWSPWKDNEHIIKNVHFIIQCHLKTDQ